MHNVRLSIRWKITLLYAVLLGTLLFGACAIIVASARAAVLDAVGPAGDRAALTAAFDQQIGHVIVPCLFGALLLALTIGLWLAGRLLRPIAQISATAQRITAGNDLAQRIGAAHVPADEVGRLATTFDAMLERLEQAFTAQRQFVADASHELRTPLTAILGHANLLRRHGQADPGLVVVATAAIIEEAERMRRLSQALLDLARADAAPRPLYRPVGLATIARDVVGEFKPLAAERALALELHITQGSAGWVLGDADQLTQVVLNLVDNALKYTPSGGQVRLKVTQISDTSGSHVVLEVADTGCGITLADQLHIFERFYRADRSRAAGGSGLGLAIARETVTQHGGVITVASCLGRGAVFQLMLPTLSLADATIAPLR